MANRLNGGSGSDRLEGLAGADVLFGGLNGDTFVFSAGHGRDIVRDFVNSSDIIDLSATAIGSIGEALANAVQTRAAVVLTTGSGDAIVLRGVTLGQLDAGDFIFA